MAVKRQPDTTPPTVSITVDPLPIARDSDFTVRGTVSDSSRVESVQVNGQAISVTATNTFEARLKSGATSDDVIVTVVAADTAGNSGSQQFTFPTRARRLPVGVRLPRSDSILTQVGFRLAIATAYDMFSGEWIVDNERQTIYAFVPDSLILAVITPLASGQHRASLHLWRSDSALARFDTSFTFTTRVDARAYEVTLLLPLAGDDDAFGAAIDDSRRVVGSSNLESRRTATIWENGNPRPLASSFTSSWANAINSSGDIVGAVTNTFGVSTPALWKDGTFRTIDTLGATREALRVNASGKILIGSGGNPQSVVLREVSSDASTMLWPEATARDLNEAGQVLAATDYTFESVSPLTFGGFSVASVPRMPRTSVHTFYEPVDLNERAEVLLSCETWWILSSRGQALFLSEYLGGNRLGSGRINNVGDVATVGADSAIYVWDSRTRTVSRVGAGSLRFDAVTAFTDAGVILAHGIDASTRRRGVIILLPSS